jgi:hypothetical protein
VTKLNEIKLKRFEHNVDKIITSYSLETREIISFSPASEETKNLVTATTNQTKYAINQLKQEIVNLFND